MQQLRAALPLHGVLRVERLAGVLTQRTSLTRHQVFTLHRHLASAARSPRPPCWRPCSCPLPDHGTLPVLTGQLGDNTNIIPQKRQGWWQ